MIFFPLISESITYSDSPPLAIWKLMLAIFDFLFSQRSGSSAGILADEIISRRFESQKRSFGHLRIRSELYATLRLLCHFTWCALWFMFWEFSGKEEKK